MSKSEQAETTPVKKYKSLDDMFIDKYVRKDGETIEEAKKRFKELSKK